MSEIYLKHDNDFWKLRNADKLIRSEIVNALSMAEARLNNMPREGYSFQVDCTDHGNSYDPIDFDDVGDTMDIKFAIFDYVRSIDELCRRG